MDAGFDPTGNNDDDGKPNPIQMPKTQVELQTLMKKFNVRSIGEAQRRFLEMKTERRELR